jgi:hypothetical protein
MWIYRRVHARKEPSIKPRIVYQTFDPPACDDLMEKSLPLSLWLGLALYAAIGLFGVVIFRDAAPITQDATGGYGISISNALAASESGK